MKKILVIIFCVLIISACSNNTNSNTLDEVVSIDVNNNGIFELGDSPIFKGLLLTFMSSKVEKTPSNGFIDAPEACIVDLYMKNINLQPNSFWSMNLKNGYDVVEILDPNGEEVEVSYIASDIMTYDKMLTGAGEFGKIVFEYTVDGKYKIILNYRTFIGNSIKMESGSAEVEIEVDKGKEIIALSEDDVLGKNYEFTYYDETKDIDDKVSYSDFKIAFGEYYLDNESTYGSSEPKNVLLPMTITNKSSEEKALYDHYIEYFSPLGLDVKKRVSVDYTNLGTKIPPGESLNCLLVFEYVGDGEYYILFGDSRTWDDRVTIKLPIDFNSG